MAAYTQDEKDRANRMLDEMKHGPAAHVIKNLTGFGHPDDTTPRPPGGDIDKGRPQARVPDTHKQVVASLENVNTNPIKSPVAIVPKLPGDNTWGDYGTRANNPGNMNYASWESAQGRYQYKDPHTHGIHQMAVYDSMEEGVADALRLMKKNQAKSGKTLAGALSGWAEHPYVDPLAKEMGISPKDTFDVTTADPQMLQTMFQKQFVHEGVKGSHTATPEQISGGISLARGKKLHSPHHEYEDNETEEAGSDSYDHHLMNKWT